MEDETHKVREAIRNEVPDWDSDVLVSTRFKAFSGQRSDWEPRYHFWRDLIIKIARHLNIFIIRASVIRNLWFNRGGLIPLCIDDVLVEMYNSGDILCSSDLIDPKSGQIAQLFYKFRHLIPLSKPAFPSEDEFIVSTLLQEKSEEVVKVLSENHWTSSCIITMGRFQVICGGAKQASVILSHLSKCGKAKYFAVRRNDLMEGVKVSLSSKLVSGTTTSSDYDVLHLTWTAEKLQLQIDVIDQLCNKAKMSALASLKSGNKVSARRHVRELKLSSESRDKCDVLLRRVEEVLRAISDAEDSKEVFEAIQSGTKALKDKMITIEEVQHCLDDLDETTNSQKQVDKIIGSVSAYEDFDEDLEDELDKLLEESQKLSSADGTIREHETAGATDSLADTLSDLKLADNVTIREPTEISNVSKVLELAPS